MLLAVECQVQMQRRMTRRLISIPCLLLSLAWGQELTIKTRVHLVVSPATVTDSKGHFIDGLTEADFELLDDGKPQKIQVDTSDIVQTPISLVIATATNYNAGAALGKIRKVGSMVEPLVTGEHGEVAILSFSDHVKVIQEFTPDAKLITKAFGVLRTDGTGARLLDAASEAIGMLHDRPAGHRKILLLISESRDRGSESKIKDVLQAAQRDDITIYTMTFSAYVTPWTTRPDNNGPPPGDIIKIVTEIAHATKTDATQELARLTGGKKLSFQTLKRLETDLGRLGEELHSQYLLSFTPSEQSNDPAFHAIQVLVKDRPDLVVVSRPGYWPEAQ
jgi:VWFA-related protein